MLFLVIAHLFLLITIYIITVFFNQCHLRISLSYFILVLIVVVISISRKYPSIFSKYSIWITILSFVFLIATSLLPSRSIYKMIMFVCFIALVGLMLSPLMNQLTKYGVFNIVLYTALGIFLVLSLISYLSPNTLSQGWNTYLVWVLLAIILVRFILPHKMRSFISLISLIVFGMFLIYDTQLLERRASDCKVYYDYIDNILGIFLDIINIFGEIGNLSISNR